ncbi:MAG: hypothetical protein QM773_09025 [Hyphomonadaceae bacterium]
MTIDDICQTLIDTRKPHDAPQPDAPGLYAIFLRPRCQLLPITPAEHGLLYAGATHDGLSARDHFTENSGFSTLRRSLGAILRKHLWLQPCPRAPGPSETNTRNYAFAVDGEAILSRWMRANLLVSTLSLPGADLPTLEAEVIAKLEPPLNLTGWDNPQRPLIKRMRADCTRLAKELARAAA